MAEPADLRIAVVVSFLNEGDHLPTFLASMAAQRRRPDELLLVDDGSSDASYGIAAAFAEAHPWARALQRPARPATADRLVDAPELRAFQWGADQLSSVPNVICKMDADLELGPDLVETVHAAFLTDRALGVTGSYLAVRHPDGRRERERTPVKHVRGPNKFYRWSCFQQISPLPAILGWDTIDEVRARRFGWSTRSLALAGGDCVHLRPTGLHDGRLRAFRRWGWCAWGYGAHPLWVVLGAARRARERPLLLCGINYWIGWAWAGLRRRPRAEAETRRQARREETASMRAILRRGVSLHRTDA